jgi:hypothetical protein
MAPPTKRNRSRFHLSSLGYASAPRARYSRTQPTHWAWNPPREPRAFKSRGTVSKEPAIKPAMAAEWQILVPVQSAPQPKPVSPAEARLNGVSRKSVNAWRAP